MSIPKFYYSNNHKSLKMKKDVLEDVVKFQKMLGRHEQKKVENIQNALAMMLDESAEFVDEFIALDESELIDNIDFELISRQNIAKEAADVIYTLVAILVSLDIPVIETIEKVNESNFSKFLPSKTLAESQLLGVRKKYGMTTDDRIEIKSCTVDGEDFYYFSRESDGKMLKPLSYLEADMSMIPGNDIEKV
jgi:NTP pyrophosphatase (non-canonical NTP hydrolase)